MLEIEGLPSHSILATTTRPDVAAYLGADGVSGFSFDLRDLDAFGVVEGAHVRLVIDGVPVASASVSETSLGDGGNVCEAGATTGMDLRRHLRPGAVSKPGLDTMQIESLLGHVDVSAQAIQWYSYFADHGSPPDLVAAWLQLKDTQANGVPFVSPLPGWLDDRMHSPATAPLSDLAGNPSNLTWLNTLAGTSASDGLAGPGHSGRQAHELRSPPAGETKVCVAGLVAHKSGLGQNSGNSIRALEDAGIHACSAPFRPWRGSWNAKLGLAGESVLDLSDHVVLLHAAIDRVVDVLSIQPALSTSPRLIGYFLWETHDIPSELQRGLDAVDEIWTATNFVADAFRAATQTPVHVTGHAVDVSGVTHIDRADYGLDDDTFVVHFSFDANSTVARKNPGGALDAFERAFGADPGAAFVLKIRNYQQAHWLAGAGDPHARDLLNRLDRMPNVILLTEEVDRGTALGLIEMADCYLSLHRSEGFGYTMAESLMLGTPVIATGYSGTSDFLTSDNSTLVGWQPVDVRPGDYFFWRPGMHWAAPDVEEAMRALIESRAMKTLNGTGRVVHALPQLGPAALSRIYRDLLADSPR
jgi:glycosyltransferase involved in cell wall biosynthesis